MNDYKHLDFHIRGVVPIMMHNPRLANPLEPIVQQIKAITSKRKKTDEDHAEIARLEHLGGLYLNDEEHPAFPGINIEAMLIKAAKVSKRGEDAKIAIVSDGCWPLIYKGPKTPDALFADKRFVDTSGVIVNRSRVWRTRPIFPLGWELKFTLSFLADIVNERDVREWVDVAGRRCALGDWRPRFGRFLVTSVANAEAA